MSRESTRAAERFVGQCIAGDVEVFYFADLGTASSVIQDVGAGPGLFDGHASL